MLSIYSRKPNPNLDFVLSSAKLRMTKQELPIIKYIRLPQDHAMPILHWLGKENDIKTADRVPYRLLQHNKELSYGDESSENMIIKGDNLDALKALLPYYAGQVKCVYIDPPYNTGHAFEHYDDNLEHSAWLSLIYPRLELLRELLSEDGSIWISIDDDESHYLKVICDEVFGRKNFVTNVIWEKKYSPQNDAKWLSDSHDHILVYAKRKETWRPNLLPRTDEMNKRYKNPDNDPRGPWKTGDVLVKSFSKTGVFPIKNPNTGVDHWPQDGSCYRFNKEGAEKLLADNRIYFGKSGTSGPQIKRFLSEVKQGSVSKTIWTRQDVADNQQAKKEVRSINSKEVFATPKPEKLIQRILTLSTNTGDMILDSFLGSGTTSAVAHKMGRKYIGIEMGEHAVTHCVPRLRKVIDGEDKGGITKAVNWKKGGGFRFYELGETVFDETGSIKQDIKFPILASHLWFTETGTPFHGKADSPLLGIFENTAYILLYNGILGDRRPDSGNVLTHKLLRYLRELLRDFNGSLVVYGESSRIRPHRLQQENIIFKQTPYDVKAR